MYYCDDLEIEAIQRVLKSKKLFRYQGQDVETECSLFEKKFARFLKTKQTILLSSGTNALVNALFCLGIKEGDEVLIPSYTFFATAAAVLELKAIPVVVNINSFLSYDEEDLGNKLNAKTRALIAVHMDGYPCDMNFLRDFCRKNSLFLVEDVAQAVGGSFQKQKLGTFGDFGCFSFNVDKIISCGEGGALCINNEELYQKAFLYHDTCNQFGPSTKNLYSIEKFSGKSMRASEIQGAMINVQLERLETILKDLSVRKKILDTHLQSMGFELISTYDPDGECNTTSRVLCSDVNEANKLVLAFNHWDIKANTPMLRPAHHIWQWQSLLSLCGPQNKFDYISSIDILSRVLLVHVTLDKDIETWKASLEKVRV